MRNALRGVNSRSAGPKHARPALLLLTIALTQSEPSIIKEGYQRENRRNRCDQPFHSAQLTAGSTRSCPTHAICKVDCYPDENRETCMRHAAEKSESHASIMSIHGPIPAASYPRAQKCSPRSSARPWRWSRCSPITSKSDRMTREAVTGPRRPRGDFRPDRRRCAR